MRRISRFPFRQVALAAVGAGGLGLLLLARPSRGQQPVPGPLPPEAIHFTAPPTADSGATTRVDCHLVLPASLTLRFHPRVRVTDAHGRLEELLLMDITQRTPELTGFRELDTETLSTGDVSGPD